MLVTVNRFVSKANVGNHVCVRITLAALLTACDRNGSLLGFKNLSGKPRTGSSPVMPTVFFVYNKYKCATMRK